MNRIRRLGQFFATHPLSRDAPLQAWVRFLGWQFKSRIHEEVLWEWIGGQYLAARRGMTGATGNIYVGLHEFPDMMALLHFIRADDLFLDIGANVGSYTVLASGVAQATTWAFEPDPQTAKHLKRNIAINGLEPRVTVFECALGAAHGEAFFTTGLHTTNRVVAKSGAGVRRVRQEQLDMLVGNLPPTMMKIDVEGYEEEVLRGASRILANPALKVIEVETATSAVNLMLMQNDFERAYYDPFSRTLSRRAIEIDASNFLYVKDWSFVSRRLMEGRSIKILGRDI
jgi:FkbM family methyltransferase